MNGPWKFQPHDKGASAPAELSQLTSWVNRPQLRCFSGTATYETSFIIPDQALAPGATLALDLGDVRDVAEVWLNGKPAGVAWRMPYTLPIAGTLQPGTNTLKVDVTNLLINTVLCQPTKDYSAVQSAYEIGTRLRPPEEKTLVKEPFPSGLLGPVRIVRTGVGL